MDVEDGIAAEADMVGPAMAEEIEGSSREIEATTFRKDIISPPLGW
jgi:hypothetical protein